MSRRIKQPASIDRVGHIRDQAMAGRWVAGPLFVLKERFKTTKRGISERR